MSDGREALEAALGLAMPSAAQTDVLRAALLDGDAGRRAFESFAHRTGDPRRLRPAAKQRVRELGPLLERARQRHAAELGDRPLKTMLRAAAQRESLRWTNYAAAIAEVVEALANAGVVPLLSGGAAVAVSAYPDPSLRHCHDLDLVVESSSQAAAALSGLCKSPAAAAPGGARHATHRSGLGLRLHAAILPESWAQTMTLAELRARARSRRVGGAECVLPSIGDLLVSVCVHGLAYRPRQSVRWAADALLLTRAADAADWQRIGELAAASGLAPLLTTSMRYLVAELDALAPAATLAGVSPDQAHREQLLAWAVRSRQRWPRSADRAGVIAALRWAIWPSAAYLDLSRQHSRAARLLRWSGEQALSVGRRLRARVST